MAMQEGIKKVAFTALDTKDQLCIEMMNAGVSPREALIASTVATKANVEIIINKVMGNGNASEITHNLAEIGRGTQTVN